MAERRVRRKSTFASARVHMGFGQLPARKQQPLSFQDNVEMRARHLPKSLKCHYEGTAAGPLKLASGMGQYLYDDDGNAYLDCVNNVCHVGHCHPRVVQAASSQLGMLVSSSRRGMHVRCRKWPLTLDLARRAAHDRTPTRAICMITSCDSRRNSQARCQIRCPSRFLSTLARKQLSWRCDWHATTREFEFKFVCSAAQTHKCASTRRRRRLVYCVDGAYHGNSAAALAVSPYSKYSSDADHNSGEARKLMMPDSYQNRLTEAEMTAKASAEYAHVLGDPGKSPAAFIVESIMCCGGQILLPDGYLQRMTALTRANGGLTIADEVQTGFGRSGSNFWAFEAHGVVPDIVTVGKPFGNGFPLAAVVTSKAVADSANMLEYFNTFGGNPVACAVGLEVLSVIRDEGLQENAAVVGDYALSQLRELQSAHPQRIGDVRGKGLLLGVEFVKDPDTRTADPLTAAYVMQRMKAQGVLVSTDGMHQSVIKMKPPMCVNKSDVDALVAAMDSSLAELSS